MTNSDTRPDSVGQAHTPGPVAYLYESDDGSKDLVLDPNGEYARRLLELGRTETPLYAHPPSIRANGDDELLAKLKEVLDFYDALPTAHAVGEVELLDSITALIAKAKGGQP